MKRHLGALAIAAAGLAASASAFADRAYVMVQPGYSAPEPVIVQRYGPPVYAYDSREYDVHRHYACDAARWDPNRRYMPGEVVRRKGEFYVATERSRHVYNENSPPEWTPNYWAHARCR